MTQAAQAAKAIRTELKEKFPGTKFSITSSNYSMGDSVTVNYDNGPTHQRVDAVADKYQAGDFNGMEDLYEYRKDTHNLPTAKYVIVQRNIDTEIIEAKTQEIAKNFGIKDVNNDQEWFDKFHRWDAKRSEARKELRTINL